MHNPPITRAAEQIAGHITKPYNLDEIGTKLLAGDYSAELMLQHLLRHMTTQPKQIPPAGFVAAEKESIAVQEASMLMESETPPCSTHPDAPHGFDRDGSHTAGRYVCDCEHWVPPESDPQGQDRGQGEGEQYDKTLQECAELRAQANNWTDEERERLGKEAQELFAAPAPQSAVEWVAGLLTDTGPNYLGLVLRGRHAKELARRCDEAEARAHNFEQGFHIHSARADEAEKPGWRQACMQIGMKLAPITQSAGVVEAVEEVVTQLAAAQARITELETELESHAWEISPAMAQAKIDQLNAQLAAAQAERDQEASNCETLISRIAKKTDEILEIRRQLINESRTTMKWRGAAMGFQEQVKQFMELHEAAQAELTRLQHQDTAHRTAWENAEVRERELREALEDIASGSATLPGYGITDAAATARAALAKKEAQP